MSTAPPVSVVMPVRNEAEGLEPSVRAVLDSGYGGTVEVVVAVGPSDDDTASIARALAADDRVRVVDNPSGLTPQGLNAAIAAARFDVVVRMDGHATMPRGYIDLAVAALEETGAANVGGRMVPTAERPFARAVAVAMGSPWGLGGVGHRSGGTAGPAASVYLGAFRREALEEVGGYDEHFARAQDWELNYRLRAAGHTVWFVPQMQVPYTPRSTWRALARQMYLTGRWRREVVRRHPGSRSLRYLAPPLATVAVLVGLIGGAIGLAAHHPWSTALVVIPVTYVAGVLLATATLARRAGAAAAVNLPVVLATTHLAWGLGFLRGVR